MEKSEVEEGLGEKVLLKIIGQGLPLSPLFSRGTHLGWPVYKSPGWWFVITELKIAPRGILLTIEVPNCWGPSVPKPSLDSLNSMAVPFFEEIHKLFRVKGELELVSTTVTKDWSNPKGDWGAEMVVLLKKW